MEERTVRERVGAMLGSPWARVVGRAAFFALVLGVLAAIGHVANANANANANAGANAEADAGANATVPTSANASANANAAPNAGARASPDSPVRLNLADEAELRRLPGVGPKRAQQILALRGRLGRFQRVEDLLRVKGVGRATVKKWRPLITLGSTGSAAHADAGGAT